MFAIECERKKGFFWSDKNASAISSSMYLLQSYSYYENFLFNICFNIRTLHGIFIKTKIYSLLKEKIRNDPFNLSNFCAKLPTMLRKLLLVFAVYRICISAGGEGNLIASRIYKFEVWIDFAMLYTLHRGIVQFLNRIFESTFRIKKQNFPKNHSFEFE